MKSKEGTVVGFAEIPQARELADVIAELESALHEWGAALERLGAAKGMCLDARQAATNLSNELAAMLEDED